MFFATTSIFVLITAIGRLGTDTGLVYFISQSKATGQLSRVRAYVLAAAEPAVLVGCCLGVVLFAFAPAIAAVTSPDDTKLTVAALRALAPFVPFAGIAYVALAATRGLGTMRPNVFTEQLMRPGLQLLVAFAIVITGVSINLAWSWSIPYAVSACLAVYFLYKTSRRVVRAPQEKGRRSREFWRFTAPRSVASMTQIAMQRLDIVLVAVLAGASAAAIYTAATRFIVLGQFARNAVSLAVQPHVAAAMATTDRSAISGLYRTSTAWLMVCTWPIFLVLLIEAQSVLKVFGHDYQVGAEVLVLLSAAMLIATFCGDVDIMLVMSGRSRQSLINNGVALILMVGLDVALIPRVGLLGAAIGWASAITCKNLLGLVQVWWFYRVWPFGSAPAIVAVASIFCFGLGAGMPRLIFGENLIALIVGVALACLSYAGWMWRARTTLALDSVISLRRLRK
ncbi:lipopolysaccharide biosynthesis protein [Spelaeicoccus albus]